MTLNPTEQTQRLDKWLKIVRLFKTRKMAADACDGRMVKVNEVTSKPSKVVKVDDEIVVRMRGKYRSFKVLGISTRSISAKIARELYEETTKETLTPEEKELVVLMKKSIRGEKPKYPGRPTKKNRREIMKAKGKI
jgi:ribosome-associated heat shock protein Hsp15